MGLVSKLVATKATLLGLGLGIGLVLGAVLVAAAQAAERREGTR